MVCCAIVAYELGLGGFELRRWFIPICCLAIIALMPTTGHAAATVDPQGSGTIINAVNWLQGTLLGTVATIAAVVAVACVGFMMLTGRINWRYGAVVILGCFILFGAASIVAGIRSAATVG